MIQQLIDGFQRPVVVLDVSGSMATHMVQAEKLLANVSARIVLAQLNSVMVVGVVKDLSKECRGGGPFRFSEVGTVLAALEADVVVVVTDGDIDFSDAAALGVPNVRWVVLSASQSPFLPEGAYSLSPEG
jgi:predicted metal-dependent peptidase